MSTTAYLKYTCNFTIYVFMYQSIPAVPIPPGQPWGIYSIVSLGGGALANLIAAQGLGISIPQGDPRAFDTHVFERWMSLSGTTRPLSKTGLSVRD